MLAHGLHDGHGIRECPTARLRRSLRLSDVIAPTARLVEQEAREKLDPALTLTFRRARTPADFASVARAYAALVGSGFPEDEAARVVGLDT